MARRSLLSSTPLLAQGAALSKADSASTSLPTRPNAGGTYIMFAGTPYAHLMVYEDPKMLKP